MSLTPGSAIDLDLPDGWFEHHRSTREGRPASLGDLASVRLSARSIGYLERTHPQGVYAHQVEAVRAALARNDVCLATGTASGKTLAFTLAAIEALERHPDGVILALYPLKALSNAQAARWEAALTSAGLPPHVARLDGSVPPAERLEAAKQAKVICMTPDLAHAWLLGRLDEPEIRRLVGRLRLVIVDEIHTYTGILGTNAAYLFRRLEHACSLAGNTIQYFAASATLGTTDDRLERLFGRPFTTIAADRDGSPRQPLHIQLVEPPKDSDVLGSAASLLEHLATRSARTLAFVDGRKQVETIVTILGRNDQEERGSLEDQWYLPYRAGYEDEDRRLIERRLADPALKVIVSTSALELGLDIPNLDAVVLLGVPLSATSIQQRIGRVGRQRPGRVIVVHSGTATDHARFADPETALKRPYPDAALYLDNRRVQFIHAMCLARQGGEHDLMRGDRPEGSDDDIETSVRFPDGFLDLCRLERTGQTPSDLYELSALGTDRPQHAFPLRSTEPQFKVIRTGFGGQDQIGQLTTGQLLREAYPGALYRHLGRGYRVLSVKHGTREVLVKPERGQATSPIQLPSQLYPNFADIAQLQRLSCGPMLLVDAPMQVQLSVTGVKVGGDGKRSFSYPLAGGELGGVRYNQQYFTRRLYTTGVLLLHPALQGLQGLDELADVLLEAFLMVFPTDRADISSASGKLRVQLDTAAPGAPFLSIFDQANGSLRISSRLLDHRLLVDLLPLAAQLAEHPGDERDALHDDAIAALKQMAADAQREPEVGSVGSGTRPSDDGTEESIAPLPGTHVWTSADSSQRFRVDRVFFSPKLSEVMVSGQFDRPGVGGQSEHWPLRGIVPIPGESLVARFDVEAGGHVGESWVFGGSR